MKQNMMKDINNTTFLPLKFWRYKHHHFVVAFFNATKCDND